MMVKYCQRCKDALPFQCVSEEEEVTREEIAEEWAFLDAVMDTRVMEIARLVHCTAAFQGGKAHFVSFIAGSGWCPRGW